MLDKLPRTGAGERKDEEEVEVLDRLPEGAAGVEVVFDIVIG